MAEYSTSAATRQALIDAAGALFAEQGVNAVTTRAIASAAHENTGSIHYHFGGKEELLDAVLDFAARPWQDDPLGRHLRENRRLLETPEGQRKLVEELVDLAFATTFSVDCPPWCNTLILQILQRDLPVSAKVFKMCVQPLAGVFASLHGEIVAGSKPGDAFAWALTVLSPMILHAINPVTPLRLFADGKLPADYFDTLKALTKASAMACLRPTRAEGRP